MHARVSVVAVVAAAFIRIVPVAVEIRAGAVLDVIIVDEPVAVVVEVVAADLECAGIDRGVHVVAVGGIAADGVPVAVLVGVLVGLAVAVVVDHVAEFGRVRVDASRARAAFDFAAHACVALGGIVQGVVVAVAVTEDRPVAVRIRLADRDLPVAVVVEAVAPFNGAQVNLGIGVVAVVAAAVARFLSVAIVVRAGAVQEVIVIDEPVAVVVDPVVAVFGRTGIHENVVIVAVGRASAYRVGIPVLVGVLVDDVITVVVDPVAAQFGLQGTSVRVVVVAIALADHRPVAVGIRFAGRQLAVAVVVLAVTDFIGADVDYGIGVIAVVAEACRIVIVVPVVVPAHTVEGVVEIDQPVAVVVEEVAAIFRSAGVDLRVVVVAVVARVLVIAGGVSVSILIIVFINNAVTVIVGLVAELESAGEDILVEVVAVAAAPSPVVTISITPFIDDAVAIVVEAVAVGVIECRVLCDAGVDGGIGIIAVRVVENITLGRRTGLLIGRDIPVTVSVGVLIVGDGHVLVDQAVAVVVHAVTDLLGVRVDQAVLVVAVPLAVGVAVAVAVGLAGRDLAVAVVVQTVADLGRARIGVCFRIVAVTAAGGPVVAVLVETLIHGSVAVVVDPVAEFGSARESRRVAVAAVAFALGVPVAVIVGLVGRNHAVTVVVDAVAHLGIAGILVRIRIVAVTAAACEPVTILVKALVGGSVTVVIDAVAGFGGTRESRCVAVGTVAFALGVPVAVVVGLVGRNPAVAVVVHAITDFGIAGIAVRVRVVAVHRIAAYVVSVTILVVAFIDNTVAVVVDKVTFLVCVRIDAPGAR